MTARSHHHAGEQAGEQSGEQAGEQAGEQSVEQGTYHAIGKLNENFIGTRLMCHPMECSDIKDMNVQVSLNNIG